MYVCLCSATTEASWREALQSCGGERERAALQTGAGLACGACRTGLATLGTPRCARDEIHVTPEPQSC